MVKVSEKQEVTLTKPTDSGRDTHISGIATRSMLTSLQPFGKNPMARLRSREFTSLTGSETKMVHSSVIPRLAVAAPQDSAQTAGQIEQFLHQDSNLTFGGKRMSNLNVMTLFFKIMELLFSSRQFEKLERYKQRREELKHMQVVLESYRSRGDTQRSTSIGFGILSMASGFLPILGYTGVGDKMYDGIKGISFLSGLSKMDRHDFFKYVSKMMSSGAQSSKSIGDINNIYQEGIQSDNQFSQDISKRDGEECTREMEEFMQKWRSCENFVGEMLRMTQQAVDSMYR